MIQLLIPMSGQGTRYQKAGYDQPKPLIPVSGVPMIERLLRNFPLDWDTTFVLAENHRATELPAVLSRLRPNGRQLFIPPHKAGPSFAALAALKAKALDPQRPVLVSYCDYAMIWDPAHFERFVAETACDAAVISYRGFHAHYLSPQKYAYSRLEGERVMEVREKGSFTDNREEEYASSGGYYFRSGELLARAIDYQSQQGLSLNGELYTSLTVQALIQMLPEHHVRVFEIPGFFQWGTPEDLQGFEYWEKTFTGYNRAVGKRGTVDQLLIPMAGLGSRFSAVTTDPKPLIPVFGQPMFEAAIASMPQPGRVELVAVNEVADRLASVTSNNPVHVTRLTETPAGQALTTEFGARALSAKGDIIVTACDHAIVLDSERWARFRAAPDCDAAVFTLKGFPGVTRKPTAYSYVVPTAEHGEFPEVARVSLKKNTTEQPLSEHLLVGTFWFRSAAILLEGIEQLKKNNVQVNGELYLDIIFDALKGLGRRSRIIPLEGYINWGDPQSLAEALYWQEVFCGRRIDARPRLPGVESNDLFRAGDSVLERR